LVQNQSEQNDFLPLKIMKQENDSEDLTRSTLFQNDSSGIEEKLFQRTKELNEKTRMNPHDINLWLGNHKHEQT